MQPKMSDNNNTSGGQNRGNRSEGRGSGGLLPLEEEDLPEEEVQAVEIETTTETTRTTRTLDKR